MLHYKKTTKPISVILITLFAFFSILPVSAEETTLTITSETRSKWDDFDYEFWIQNKGENASMTLTGGGTFYCNWTDTFNVLFRMGKRLGSIKTYDEYGDIFIEYAAEHSITKGDVSYLCIYGWTQNPLIEFYVIENHGNYKPGKIFHGTIEVDGGIYDVYTDTRVEQPSIEGTKTFEQYFSIRKSKRTEGTISLTEHFKAWEELGLDMSGTLWEVMLCVEGFGGSGRADIYKHILTIGDDIYGENTERLSLLLALKNATSTKNTEVTDEIPEVTEPVETIIYDITEEPELIETVTRPVAKKISPGWSVFIAVVVLIVIMITGKIIEINMKMKKKNTHL